MQITEEGNKPKPITKKKKKKKHEHAHTQIVILTPVSVAMGFPRRLSSDSNSAIVLLISAWRLGILDLITVSKCCKFIMSERKH